MLYRMTKKMAEIGMTQRELCKRLGVSETNFIAWKKGKNTSYKQKVNEISSILGVSIEYLLTGEERQTTKAEEFYNRYLMQSEKIKSVIDILLS